MIKDEIVKSIIIRAMMFEGADLQQLQANRKTASAMLEKQIKMLKEELEPLKKEITGELK